MSSSSLATRSISGSANPLPVAKIEPQRYGRRSSISRDEVAELAESMGALGQLTPVFVVANGEGFQLVAGARRLAAAELLGWTEIQAVVLEGDEAQHASVALAENVARESMNPLDEARCLRELMDFEGMSMSEASRRLGRSGTWVRTRLQLLDWPEDLQVAIAAGRLAVATAGELVKIEDDEYRVRLVDHAMLSGVSAEVARRWVWDWRTSRAARTASELDAIGWTPPAEAPAISHRCHVCESMYAWEETAAVYVCRGCLDGLERAKREQG